MYWSLYTLQHLFLLISFFIINLEFTGKIIINNSTPKCNFCYSFDSCIVNIRISIAKNDEILLTVYIEPLFTFFYIRLSFVLN